MEKGVISGMVDDQPASTPDKGLQGLLNAERPLDPVFLMTAVEIIDYYVVAGKIGGARNSRPPAKLPAAGSWIPRLKIEKSPSGSQ